MNVKKRKKNTRHRGTHTHSRGAKKKARGKGHRGGVGMSGSGKKSDQKKSLVLKKYGNKYFGRDKTLKRGMKKNIEIINLNRVVENIDFYVKKGIGKENSGVYELNFKNFKIIGKSKLNIKLKINALAASKGAIESVKEAGGEIIIEEKELDVKEE